MEYFTTKSPRIRNKVIVPNCADFRTAFRKTIEKILKIELSNIKNYTNIQKKIMGNLLSVSIEYAYLDWLAGEFGDIHLR